MGSTAEAENTARIFLAGEKSNACRTRRSCKLFGEEFRQPACPPSVRWVQREFKAVVRYLRSLQGQTGAASVSGDPKRGRAHLLWPGRLLAVSHGERRGRLHRLRSFQLRQHACRQTTFELRLPIPTGISILENEPVIVTTADGQTLTGVARNEDNFSLQLQTT